MASLAMTTAWMVPSSAADNSTGSISFPDARSSLSRIADSTACWHRAASGLPESTRNRGNTRRAHRAAYARRANNGSCFSSLMDSTTGIVENRAGNSAALRATRHTNIAYEWKPRPDFDERRICLQHMLLRFFNTGSRHNGLPKTDLPNAAGGSTMVLMSDGTKFDDRAILAARGARNAVDARFPHAYFVEPE